MPPTGDPSAQPAGRPRPALAACCPRVARSLGVPGGGAAERPTPVRPAAGPARGGRARRRAGPRPAARSAAGTRRSCARHLAAHPAGGQRLPVDHGHLDGHLRHRACRRAPTGCSATRCSTRRPTGCSTSCPGRTAPTRCAWQPHADGLRGAPRPTASTVDADRPGLLRRVGPHQRGPARRPLRRGRASLDAAGRRRPGRRARRRRGRSSTSTGASSTRSATCTAASRGSGATSSSAIDRELAPAGRAACPDDCS